MSDQMTEAQVKKAVADVKGAVREETAKVEAPGTFDGKKLTIAAATMLRVNSYLRDITLFIRVLTWRGQYYKRREIKMTDVELDEYTAVMTREIATLAVDAVVFEAFLLMQDDKAARRGWLERFLTRRRAPLHEQWRRFSGAIKRRIYISKGAAGPVPHIANEQEVVDDERKRDEVPRSEISEVAAGAAAQGGEGQVPGEQPAPGGAPEGIAPEGGAGGGAARGGGGDGASPPG